MSIGGYILLVVIIGVVLYLVNKYIPMDPKIKTILTWTLVIVIIIVSIWFVMGLFGMSFGDLGLNRPVGKMR